MNQPPPDSPTAESKSSLSVLVITNLLPSLFPSIQSRLFIQLENKRDHSSHSNRNAVQDRRFESPAASSIPRGTHEHWMTAHDPDRLYAALRRDDYFNGHLAWHSNLLCQRRIDRHDLLDRPALKNL